ncbi:MAG: NfeD family protein [Anaerovoracaceae bacterium]|jgi:membrane protein implicated in regulation of membrane protease activity
MGVLWIWIIVMFIGLIIEFSKNVMIAIWFSFGALAAVVASLFGLDLWLQVVVFLVASVVLLVLFRKPAKAWLDDKKSKAKKKVPKHFKTGTVTQTIDSKAPSGKVKLGRNDWTAVSEDGEVIEEGATVDIVEYRNSVLMDSVVLIVKRHEETEE